MKPKSYRYAPQVKPAPRPDDKRPTARERGYNHEWARLRNWYAAQHPVCQWEKCTQAMAIVDHIEPIKRAPHRRLDPDNLQSLCHRHHRVKTERDKRDDKP